MNNMEWERKKRNPFILGLTGGVGAGKSRILEILNIDYGFCVIQTDQVAKRLMQPGTEICQAVAEYLGASILDSEGMLNRSLMAEILFSDPVKRAGVDAIVHPGVWEVCFKEAEEAGEGRAVIETAIPSLIFRSGCQEIWYVYTSRENRISRLKKSRGYGEESIFRMMEQQKSEEEFRSFSDAVIDNNGTLEDTREQIGRLMEGVKERLHSKFR